MIPYYLNEALLLLPDVRGLVDRSRQFIEIELEDGATLDLVIARAPLAPNDTLQSCVETGLADQRRMLRGFTLLSSREHDYAALSGIEVRLQFIDKKEGPIYHHEFHALTGQDRIGFHGICAVAHAGVCDRWMQSVLTGMKLREE